MEGGWIAIISCSYFGKRLYDFVIGFCCSAII
jgi:hypothetical protein